MLRSVSDCDVGWRRTKAMSERKKRLEKKLTMKMMDDDFNERTSFFRVVSPRTSMLAPIKSLRGIDGMFVSGCRHGRRWCVRGRT